VIQEQNLTVSRTFSNARIYIIRGKENMTMIYDHNNDKDAPTQMTLRQINILVFAKEKYS
jgi:hypothetical protein